MRGVKNFAEEAGTYYPAFKALPVAQFGVIFLITLITTSLAAACTWYFIEEPGIRLGRRIIAMREPRIPVNP
jgi:peptidoglycan/LPS O-acetylase OafA/YrhL